MAQSLLPRGRTEAETDLDSRTVAVEEADAVIGALAPRTARRILAEVASTPLPPSAVADRLGLSIQNAAYHLSQLRDADLVAVVDTWYSSRGQEMDVYAPVSDPVVLRLGDEDQPTA